MDRAADVGSAASESDLLENAPPSSLVEWGLAG